MITGWTIRNGTHPASNSKVERNIDNIVEFDVRFREARGQRDKAALLELGAWAHRQGLTLGHLAMSAASEI
jgi:hypothetical protein